MFSLLVSKSLEVSAQSAGVGSSFHIYMDSNEATHTWRPHLYQASFQSNIMSSKIIRNRKKKTSQTLSFVSLPRSSLSLS